MEQLDKWNKEMRRLSVAKFAETDDALYNYYKEALKSLKAEIKQYTDNYEQLSFSKRLEVENRLKTANRIDGILNDLNSWSDAEIRRYIENEIEVGYYGTWYALEGAENVQLDFGILPERYIETLVNEKVNGQTFSKLLYKKRDELAERVTSALLTSAINGKGYAHAAKEVGELTEASYKQALRIARTEGGRAQSTAKQKAYKEAEKKGVQLEKRWLSTLDKKTRHSHQELDGQTVAVDGQFNFNGHKADGPRLFKRASLDINCRCTTVAVVNGIAPDVRKDNLTGEQIEYTNYKDWYASKKTQQTMGKKKYADYVDGLSKKYKTKDFSELLDRMTEKEYEKLSIIDVTDDIVEDIKPKAKTFDAKAIMGKTNMLEMVGEENFNGFVKHLDSVKDERIRNLYDKLGGKIEYYETKQVGAFARGNIVQTSPRSFTGDKESRPFEVVQHENGHAFDSLGMEILTGEKKAFTGRKVKKKILGSTSEFDEIVFHASGLPEYDLKNTINQDLWRYVNGDELPTFKDIGKRPRKAAEKIAWEELSDKIYSESKENFAKFYTDMKAIQKEDFTRTSAISDIAESTGYLSNFGDFPFGAGHGKKYWSTSGNAETEFFAHFMEIMTVKTDDYEMFNLMFPESMKICEQIIDDILKKVGD